MHLAVLGNARSYHFQKWLPALADRPGLQVSLVSFQPLAEPMPGVAYHRLTPPFSRGGRFRYIDYFGSTAPLRALLHEIKADVLLASYATHYGVMGARSGFHPLVLQTWTVDLTVYPWKGWKQVFFRPLVRYALSRADLITTDGPALAEIGRQRYPDLAHKMVSTAWGIRLADYTPHPGLCAEARHTWGIPPDAPLLTSGRGVYYWYRPEAVLPALLRALATYPDAHALVLTLGQDRTPEVQRALDALAAHPRARIADQFLSRAAMQGVWAMTDAFLSFPPYDGISESVLEAMYAGAVPIVSDIPSNRAFLDPETQAVYVHGADAEAVYQALCRVLDHLPAHKARMAPVNRHWVETHATLEGTAEALHAHLSGLV